MRFTAALSLCLLMAGCDGPSGAQADTAGNPVPKGRFGNLPIELNLIGYENSGARLNYQYVLPSERVIAYFASKGIKTYRLTMAWERMQPVPFGPIPEDKAVELDAFLDMADRYGIKVIPDLHNFARHHGVRLGDPGLPIETLGDFWRKFAIRFKNRFHGFDLMNEPHEMPTPQTWPKAAQAAVDEIRKVDMRTIIYVEGDDWSNAARWKQSNGNLDIHDPARRLIYSAHIYFDRDTSGQYRNSFAKDGVPQDIGAERLKPFVEWLREKGFKGHIGEFGIPYADKGWYPVLDGFLNEAARDQDVLVGVSYWGAGTWMDFYDLTVQPAVSDVWEDRPQLGLLLKPRDGSQ